MEKPGGPRIYVPVSLPDGNGNHSINGFINNNNSHNNNNHNNNHHNNPSSNMGRTYAVLEFKGFSGGPMPAPSQISSSVLPFPGTAGDSLLQRMLVPRGPPLSGGGGGGGGTFSITHHLKPDALLPAEGSGGSGFHMVWPGGGGSVVSGSGNGSSGVNFLTATAARDSPSLSPSPTAASCQALDQNSASATVAAGVSISHTDRDTIVHTDSSNFRDVVHQLTGASKDEATLPVTLPARSAARAAAAAASSAGQDPLPPTSATLAPRRQPTKLHERRKALRNLEKLTTGTSSKELVPSPVTPLASDFDKICNFLSAPTTPSPRGSAASSATRRSPPSPLPLPLSAAVALPLAALGPPPPPTSSSSNSSSSSISSPRLLSLFPESPVCSPKSFPR